MKEFNDYRKPGGLSRLVKDLELMDPVQSAAYLNLIREARWRRVIAAKMLSLERIFSWDIYVISQIFDRLTPEQTSICFHGVNPTLAEQILCNLNRGATSIFKLVEAYYLKPPTPQQQLAARCELIRTARHMLEDLILDVRSIDPQLIIDDQEMMPDWYHDE